MAVIFLSGIRLPASGPQTKPYARQVQESRSASQNQEHSREQKGVPVEREQDTNPVIRIREDQFERLIENIKSNAPRIGRFPVDLPTILGAFAAILNAILWVTAIKVSRRIASAQTRHNSQQTAISLHAQYFGVEHYLNVVAPVVEIRMKWMHLTEPARQKYRNEVIEGWPPYDRYTEDRSGFRRYLPESAPDVPDKDFSGMHFKDQKQRQSLTEHQALAAFLHFWSHLSAFISKGVADRDTCIELFSDTYRYNLDFIRELRDAVVKNWPQNREDHRSSDRPPRWVASTQLLEQQLYGNKTIAEPTQINTDHDSSIPSRPVTARKGVWLSLAAILLICFAFFLTTLLTARDRIWSDPTHWGPFGEYVGGILGPILAIINILVITYIAYHLHHLEAAREETSRRAQQASALRAVTLAQWDVWNSREMLKSRVQTHRLLADRSVSWKTLQSEVGEEKFQHVSEVAHFFDGLLHLFESKVLDAELAKKMFSYYFESFDQQFERIRRADSEAKEDERSRLLNRLTKLTNYLELEQNPRGPVPTTKGDTTVGAAAP